MTTRALLSAWCMKPPEILFDLHSGKESESNPHILKDDFIKCKVVLRITNKFILMGQMKI